MSLRDCLVIVLAFACTDAAAQTTTASSPAPTSWTFGASAATYFVRDDENYLQPTFTVDRGRLHLEARYNYEDLRTASAWIGWNFSAGKSLALELTPIAGLVFGDTRGVAPVEWGEVGVVVQRTRAYESDRDAQRGLLLGLSHGRGDLSAIAFNPDEDTPLVVVTAALEF